MTPRARHAVESCALQLHAWKPFEPSIAHQLRAKKPCLSDRSTAPHAEALDFSRLSLVDESPSHPTPHKEVYGPGLRWIARKRRRRGSRSVSGRSSDRSGTRRAAYATCSDFPLAAGGTDSSGEFFVNGDGSWGSDVSEAVRASGKRGDAKEIERGALERDGSGPASNQVGGATAGALEAQGNESGYGSEPGYRGDGELGYDDEIDEEEDEGRLLFWGGELGDHMEIVGENNFSEQKAHHRCRRKKHDWRMVTNP